MVVSLQPSALPLWMHSGHRRLTTLASVFA